MEINPKLEVALNKIDFIANYKELSERYKIPAPDRKWTQEELESVIAPFGYSFKYIKNNDFFKIDALKDNPSHISLNLAFPYGNVEFILNIVLDEKGDGGPFGFICELLGATAPIKKPKFKNLEELSDILKAGFELYENIKKQFYPNKE